MGFFADELRLIAESIDVLDEKMAELLAGRDENGVVIDPTDRDSWGPLYVPVEVQLAHVSDALRGTSRPHRPTLVWCGDPDLGFMLKTSEDSE